MTGSYIQFLLLQDLPDSYSKQSGCKAFLTLYASSRSLQITRVTGWYMSSRVRSQSLGSSWGSPHSKYWDFKRILLNTTQLKSGEETGVSLPFIWSESLQWQRTVSGLEDKETETSSSWWCARSVWAESLFLVQSGVSLAVSVPRADVFFQHFITILSSLLQDPVPYIQYDTEVFPLPHCLCPPRMNDRQFHSSQEKGVCSFSVNQATECNCTFRGRQCWNTFLAGSCSFHWKELIIHWAGLSPKWQQFN